MEECQSPTETFCAKVSQTIAAAQTAKLRVKTNRIFPDSTRSVSYGVNLARWKSDAIVFDSAESIRVPRDSSAPSKPFRQSIKAAAHRKGSQTPRRVIQISQTFGRFFKYPHGFRKSFDTAITVSQVVASIRQDDAGIALDRCRSNCPTAATRAISSGGVATSSESANNPRGGLPSAAQRHIPD